MSVVHWSKKIIEREILIPHGNYCSISNGADKFKCPYFYIAKSSNGVKVPTCKSGLGWPLHQLGAFKKPSKCLNLGDVK